MKNKQIGLLALFILLTVGSVYGAFEAKQLLFQIGLAFLGGVSGTGAVATAIAVYISAKIRKLE